ncbi:MULTISPECIES: hypothetical protein [Bacillus cereus group]|uniref:hypothetical protein n=1 Tax=Bacillus cereus group TaxID=86661 RepID=UPI0012989F35|nr:MULTISPECIES: hypothetical protein [Bacillus cereus group]MCR6787889.1 hypothetical protein [Bacillus thuringiensis]MCR6822425.1 hypothetical protein [Bacillus thuringiensis]MCR6829965.1 hypothetical protein [Bacillus thuringiensis]MEB8931065.1 hypothetical protein [Bacillus cereus]MEB9324991.1 hypothetical protein [Bacillus cereus]
MKLLVAQPVKTDEVVKELQDKVISIQDHQISFLNDSLANFLSYAGWIVGIAGLILVGIQVGIGAFIKRQNDKTQIKMQEAESKMNEASQKLTEAENKIEQANQLSAEANDKLEQLKAQQNEIEGLLNSKELEEKLNEIDSISRTAKMLETQVSANSHLSEASRILKQGLELYAEREGDSPIIKNEIMKARQKYITLDLKIRSRKYEVDSIIMYDNSTIFSVLPRESRELYDEAVSFRTEAKAFVETYRGNTEESIQQQN